MTSYVELVDRIIELIEVIIPAIFLAVFAYFVWKVTDAWILNAGDETKRREGKQYAVVAIIIFVVMITIWSIVRMVRNSLF